MDYIDRTNLSEVSSLPEKCSYCGAHLNRAYYFCLTCATPHREIDSGLTTPFQLPRSEGEIIKQEVPQVWTVFWTYAAVILLVGILGYLVFPKEKERIYTALIGTFGIGATTVFFEFRYWKSLVVQFRQWGIFRIEFGIGLLGLLVLLVVNYLYHLVLLRPYLDNPYKDYGTGLLLFVFCLMPAFTEEIAFRGLVQHWLHIVLKPWRAILFASVLFTALHFSFVSAPYLFMVGLLLGWVKWKTQSLYPCMLIHFLHNAIVLFCFPMVESAAWPV